MTITDDLQRIEKRADTVLDNYRADIARLRADRDLTREARQLRADARYNAYRAQLDDLFRERVEAREALRRDVARRLYGYTPFSGADLVRRDADDRAGRLDSPSAALEALVRAELAGDTTLARAIFLTARERGWREPVDRFIVEHPADADDLAALDQLDADERAEFTNAARYSLIRQEV